MAKNTNTVLASGDVSDIPIGIRNNNPGNLAPGKILYANQTGVDKSGYAVFKTFNDGIAALITDIKYKINNRNLNSLRKLFVRYLDVPASHTMKEANDYARFVQMRIGANNIDEPITDLQAFAISNAIALYENGSSFWPEINEKFASYNKILAQSQGTETEQPAAGFANKGLVIVGVLAVFVFALPKILKSLKKKNR
jgi:hypothetical protein